MAIDIAFHPLDERFEVANPAIRKDKNWIPNVAPVINGSADIFDVVDTYLDRNPDADKRHIRDALNRLQRLNHRPVGVIELAEGLDVETVTEIFIRINSKGVELSQADFAMSKIAASDLYNGATIRKAIEYFCHAAVAPEFIDKIAERDKEFAATDHFQRMRWLRNETDDLYDPSYTDMLRVSFGCEFDRGKMGDLVALLSGRNFETKTFEAEIAEASFGKLESGIAKFSNKTNFDRFVMIIKSAGFIDAKLVRSQNNLNFAYIIFLKLRSLNVQPAKIESLVRRWYVLSTLTQRYTGSPESQYHTDLQMISERSVENVLTDLERALLSDAFWDAGLPQNLITSATTSPFLQVFWASQVKSNDPGFLSTDITVRDLISHHGDVHHIWPHNYLKKSGLKRRQYNQLANYVYMQSEINIRIGDKPPAIYFSELYEQCSGGETKYGGIEDANQLKDNLAAHCIPESIAGAKLNGYDDFLEERRALMAHKIRDYYHSL